LLDRDRPDSSFGLIVRKRHGQIGREPQDHVLEPSEPADQSPGIRGELTADVPVVILSPGHSTVVVVTDRAQRDRVQRLSAGLTGYPRGMVASTSVVAIANAHNCPSGSSGPRPRGTRQPGATGSRRDVITAMRSRWPNGSRRWARRSIRTTATRARAVRGSEPLRWRKPRLMFVNSMSDAAHARVSNAEIAKVFAVMALARQHTFQLLTKRPRRLARLLASGAWRMQVGVEIARLRSDGVDVRWERLDEQPLFPLPNVWIGTSIESDDYCWRADELRHTPAEIRFLSLEPLLGPLPSLDLTRIDWVIVGGESGPNFRKLDLDWVRDIRDRCRAQGVALFFKQVGGASPKAGGRLLDGQTWDEFPSQLSTVGRG
jgi:protein gp37